MMADLYQRVVVAEGKKKKKKANVNMTKVLSLLKNKCLGHCPEFHTSLPVSFLFF